MVANEHNLDHIYSSLCEGQSLNPDEEDMDQQDQGQIDLSGFTWAEGYGPEFLTGAPQVNGGGDATPNIAGLNVSYLDHPVSVIKSLEFILQFFRLVESEFTALAKMVTNRVRMTVSLMTSKKIE